MSLHASRSLRVALCRADQLGELASLLDAEFVLSKGRAISLAERFPNVLGSGNCQNLYVALAGEGRGETLCSAAAVKRFDWLGRDRLWHGAMVGLVCTAPAERGQGIASAVLRRIRDDLYETGVDFAVLWTTRPGFYSRLGWVSEDTSLFGEALSGEVQTLPRAAGWASQHRPLSADDVPLLESIRSRWLPERVQRTPLDYLVLPMPASSLDLFTAQGAGAARAYALVGRRADTGYLYEMVGDPATFEDVWESVVAACPRLYVNDWLGSLSSEWLNRKGCVAWTRQSLAMWLRLSRDASTQPAHRWVIPYFDRM